MLPAQKIGEVHVEHLHRVESVDFCCRRCDVYTFLLLRVKECSASNAETTLVGDIFTESVLSVSEKAGKHFNFIKLLNKTLCEFAESLCILGESTSSACCLRSQTGSPDRRNRE